MMISFTDFPNKMLKRHYHWNSLVAGGQKCLLNVVSQVDLMICAPSHMKKRLVMPMLAAAEDIALKK